MQYEPLSRVERRGDPCARSVDSKGFLEVFTLSEVSYYLHDVGMPSQFWWKSSESVVYPLRMIARGEIVFIRMSSRRPLAL